jgi:hypothetical protein
LLRPAVGITLDLNIVEAASDTIAKSEGKQHLLIDTGSDDAVQSE